MSMCKSTDSTDRSIETPDGSDIENAYNGIKEFAPWTTSKDYAVRLFHFVFSMLLYDMWLLVDLLVQLSLSVVEFRTKPRIIAPRFRGFLQRRSVTLL